MKQKQVDISELEGLTFTSIEGKVGDYEIIFTTNNGRRFVMAHDQECCEKVIVEDITGDMQDLIGSPILLAEQVTYKDEDPDEVKNSSEIDREYRDDSFTWTFYKFATIKGYVDIRWYGESNGYYSESVDLVEHRVNDYFHK